MQEREYLAEYNLLASSVNADTLTWSKMCMSSQPLPPRAGHCTVSLGNSLFVFGGFTEAQCLYNDLHMLDIGMSNIDTCV